MWAGEIVACFTIQITVTLEPIKLWTLSVKATLFLGQQLEFDTEFVNIESYKNEI